MAEKPFVSGVRHVLIELKQSPALNLAAEVGLREFPSFAEAAPGLRFEAVAIDPTFPAVRIPSTRVAIAGDLFRESINEAVETGSIILRGEIAEGDHSAVMDSLRQRPDVLGVYSDPLIEPFLTCIDTPAVGTDADVAQLLGTATLRANGMDGAGVLLAIVDTGINLDYLRSKGKNPNFNSTRSWVPPGVTDQPGELAVAHGTMCAFDALIAAPNATLLDIAVLASHRSGPTVMDGLLSDAILGYSFLLQLLLAPRRPGDFQSLVVSNSWGMFNSSWDFPPGQPGNYSDNANHPFNRVVGSLERAGADILFAAGNCGHECPDSRCGGEVDAGIYGANSHPQVLSIAGVDIQKNRVGYSTRGPGHLEKKKPDISSFTHFRGSGVFPVDGGTSAATPVAAGVIAALRSRIPSPAQAPAALRGMVIKTAEDRGNPGFDYDYGWGIVAPLRVLASVTGTQLDSRGVTKCGCTQKEDTSMSDAEFTRAIAEFSRPGMGPNAANAQGDVCQTYAKVKPILHGIIPFISLIPKIGKPAASAIQALMAGLDSFCGSSGSQSQGAAPGAAGLASDAAEREFLQALSYFDRSAPSTYAPTFDIGSDICGIYGKVRPILKGLLPFLSLIPVYGPAVSAAVTALMSALDSMCHLQ